MRTLNMCRPVGWGIHSVHALATGLEPHIRTRPLLAAVLLTQHTTEAAKAANCKLYRNHS